MMWSRLIFVSVSDIDFLPQLARTGSYERSNRGRLAKGWRLQSKKVKQTFNCSQARTIAPPLMCLGRKNLTNTPPKV